MKAGSIIENLDYAAEHLHAIRLSPFYVCHVINLALPFVRRKHLQIIYFLMLLYSQTSSCKRSSAALRQGDDGTTGCMYFSNFSKAGQLFLRVFFFIINDCNYKTKNSFPFACYLYGNSETIVMVKKNRCQLAFFFLFM